MGKSRLTFSMSSFRPANIVSVSYMCCRNMVADQFIQIRFYGRELDLLRYVKGKGIDQQGLGGILPDAPGPEVEQGLFAELPHRGSVAAFHIIRIYLQLGF